MKAKLKKIIHSKTFITILIILLIAAVSLAGTYAWFTWSSTENTSLTMTIGKLAEVMFTNGNTITTELTPVFNYYDGEKTTFSINNRDTSDTSIKYIVKLNITTIPSELRSESVKYSLVKNGELVTTGDLSEAYDNSIINVYSDVLSSGITPYTFYLYIDGNIENDLSMMNKTIVGNITVEAFEFTGSTLVELISSTYNNAEKTEVTNSDITYNYATSVSLMNDRLGGQTEDYDAGNIRYYGTDPNNYIDIGDVYTEDTEIDNFEKNNLLMSAFEITDRDSCYTYFDCSTNYSAMGITNSYTDEASCKIGLQRDYKVSSVDEICGVTTKKTGEPKLYRIIGLFKDIETADGTKKDLVKVIREDSIGVFAWDFKYDSSTDTTTSDNNWNESTLQNILNNEYYKAGIGTHSYVEDYAEDTAVNPFFNISFDLTKKGFNNTVPSKIETVNWILDTLPSLESNDSFSVYEESATFYLFERDDLFIEDYGLTPTIWTGKIALMYLSDYSYATDLSQCLESGDDCSGNAWLSSYANGNIAEYVLAPVAYDPNNLFNFGSNQANALVVGMVSAINAPMGLGVRPTFFLKSDISVVSGDGTEINPYVVR